LPVHTCSGAPGCEACRAKSFVSGPNAFATTVARAHPSTPTL
jgi:hypothetical protein